MNPSYEDFVDQTFSKRYRQLELDIMRDIVRRIKKTSEITSSADWQIMRLTIMGNSAEEIRNMIKEAGELSENDMQKLFDDVVEKEYTRSADLYKEVGANFVPYEQNTEMQQLTQALITQSNNELKSITGTMGFMLDYGDGKGLRFTPHTEIFSDYLNNAVMGVASGAFDYNTMIRKVVTQMTNSGLRTVDYASGRHDRVDVAARRAVLTGLSQLTGRITDTNAAALNTDHFEVAWHAGARPTHQEWQGRVWSKKELVDVCGLGSVTGLLGANCYHDYYPFIPGVSERMYSDEWLDQMNREENTPKTFMGKEYTAYEARQHQRYIERCMRAQREKVELLKEGGADKDEVMLARCKYQAQLDEYKRFSKAMKLPEQRERIYYDMKGRIAPPRDVYQKFLAEQAEKRRRIQTEADKHKERAEEARRAEIEANRIQSRPAPVAKTLEEAQNNAQAYVAKNFMDRTFKGQVNLKGISVDHANEIVQALQDVYDNFPGLEKLSGIKVVSPKSAQGKKAFKDGADALFSYSPIEHGIFVNKDLIKDDRTFAAYIQRSREAWDTVMNNLDKLSPTQKAVALRYKEAGRELVSDKSVADLVVHEMGHHVQWTMLDPKTTNAITANRGQFATQISGYATSSSSEYLAESFAAYMKGEIARLDPEYVEFLRKHRKK